MSKFAIFSLFAQVGLTLRQHIKILKGGGGVDVNHTFSIISLFRIYKLFFHVNDANQLHCLCIAYIQGILSMERIETSINLFEIFEVKN